ncbi:MAG: polysaccharide pyruvyl transferase family protein [Fibrobacter sp.]|nr:polysaccharide pyruvyl transferase family protein [Fibrobacter sp.]
MIFILSGCETHNKGAELMLYAIIQEIERLFPNATVYFDVGAIPQGFGYLKTPLKLKEKPIEKWNRLYYKLHIYGIVRRLHLLSFFDFINDVHAIKNADYFLDASGFRFSDQWNWSERTIQQKRKLWSQQAKYGCKMVFLPQAFGPFEKESSKRHLSDMASYADLIMPREQISFEYIKNSGVVNMKKVRQYSDFTSLVHGIFPERFAHLKNAVCIIPNSRMIDKGAIAFDDYIHFLTGIIETARQKNFSVYLLNHEGHSDEVLAYKCREFLKDEIEVVSGLNALEVKGLISTSRLVVSSRFHGVASALNSCVPCLATSWSHKYAELFKDYGLDDCILPLHDLRKAFSKVMHFLSDDKNMEIRNHLKSTLPLIEEQTKKMWADIWNLL